MFYGIKYHESKKPQPGRGYALWICDKIGSQIYAILDGDTAAAAEDLNYTPAGKGYAMGGGRKAAYPNKKGRGNGMKAVIDEQGIEIE